MLTDSLSPKAPSFLGLYMRRFLANSHTQLPRAEPGQLSLEGGHFSPVLSTHGQVERERLAIHVPVPSGFSSQAQHPGVPASGSAFLMHWRAGPGQVGWGSIPHSFCVGKGTEVGPGPPVLLWPVGGDPLSDAQLFRSVYGLLEVKLIFSRYWKSLLPYILYTYILRRSRRWG